MGGGHLSRLIVVSNRVVTDSSKATAGGLAVALQAALKQSGGMWVGWNGNLTDAAQPRAEIAKSAGVTYATMDLARDDYEDYYNGFANRTLWPLFHYRTDLTVYDRRFYEGYQRVNGFFAQTVTPLLAPDDLVWVHDYHMILLGEELRRRGAKQAMGYFLHIPFPATEVMVTMPNHQALVRALFAYDIVGFQTEADLRNFADYVVFEAGGEITSRGMISAFGRTIRAEVFPIGLDTENFLRLAKTAEARRYYERIVKSVGERQLIIGVDRLDYTKGLLERLAAIERLFTDYPDNRGRVVMLQVAPSSRSDVPEYIDMRHELEAVTGRINGRFAEFDWSPIRYLNRLYSRRALAGLYRASRIGLVTPFRDGMNLVAKEFVAAQDPRDPGVLVLSRFAGAARQMQSALIVNPYDGEEVVEAIQRGLHMPRDERRERHKTLLADLKRDDVYAWRDSFVAALEDARTEITLDLAS